MLKADFHMHTLLLPRLPRLPREPRRQVPVKVGLNCIAVTDHNTTEGAKVVKSIAPFFVIVGEEVRTSEGEVTGLFLDRDDTAGTYLSPRPSTQDQGPGRTGIHPPPFRQVPGRGDKHEGGLKRSSSTPTSWRSSTPATIWAPTTSKALDFANEHGLLASGVSDAHTTMELGRTYVEMPDFDGTPGGLQALPGAGKDRGPKDQPPHPRRNDTDQVTESGYPAGADTGTAFARHTWNSMDHGFREGPGTASPGGAPSKGRPAPSSPGPF